MHITIIGPGADELAGILVDFSNGRLDADRMTHDNILQLLDYVKHLVGRINTIHSAENFKDK